MLNYDYTKVNLGLSRSQRIYLSGPMTGIEDYNFPAFNAEAARLRDIGWHVENPADHGIVPDATREDYLRYDVTRLASCSTIHMLPGWSSSMGARFELQIALVLKMGITYAKDAEIEIELVNKLMDANFT